MNDETKNSEDRPQWPMKINLQKPVFVDGNETSELTLREPTASDIVGCGIPATLDFSGDVPQMKIAADAMTRMIAALAGTTPASLKKMDTRDWTNTAWSLAPFFLPSLEVGG